MQRPTPGEETRLLVRRVYEEAINRNLPALVDELYAADYVAHTVHYAPQGSPHLSAGRDPLKQEIAAWHNAMPDVFVTIDEMIAEGDRVTTRWTVSGTHHGPYCGVPPSGRTVTYSGFTTARIAAGRIVEEWILCDRAGLWQQLDLVSPGAESGAV
jgi:steroid delta-isomerase-like uncharacterized protein